MARCVLCYPFTRNEAEFLIIFGGDEELYVCKWCLQDLCLLGFNANVPVLVFRPCQKLVGG
jgi:hypothetical protein